MCFLFILKIIALTAKNVRTIQENIKREYRRDISQYGFEEEGIFNRETGQSFLDNILTRGGSEEPMVLFKRFRGREPQLDAMLEHYGIKG